MIEMVVDFRRAQSDHSPLDIDGSNVEIVKNTKFLSVQDLTGLLNTSSITKKAQQRLYFLQRLRKAHLPPLILTTFYRGTIESILSSCITAWFRYCIVSDHKTLQQIVMTAEKIIGVSLPSITDIYSTRCIRKANSIVDDPTQTSHTLFSAIPRSLHALLKLLPLNGQHQFSTHTKGSVPKAKTTLPKTSVPHETAWVLTYLLLGLPESFKAEASLRYQHSMLPVPQQNQAIHPHLETTD
ncbi:hypothetical protein QTP70_026882 [Hemibagrus guttatus]|uniref:Alkylated DNA repair protein AlkB homologue 8 N-terminal domain-containing protein n=1 Tax=Hemibagrus guttatus TaxID=175788 RepID=A0AAE0V6G8_9TELE|nr:hypothetical protein QTP70_026882 [Hemibagrus guttatus]